jgi:hypothetical protein
MPITKHILNPYHHFSKGEKKGGIVEEIKKNTM